MLVVITLESITRYKFQFSTLLKGDEIDAERKITDINFTFPLSNVLVTSLDCAETESFLILQDNTKVIFVDFCIDAFTTLATAVHGEMFFNRKTEIFG